MKGFLVSEKTNPVWLEVGLKLPIVLLLPYLDLAAVLPLVVGEKGVGLKSHVVHLHRGEDRSFPD